ncbi:MAG: ArsR family transcriptional regulator [Frankiales bacterium]|nr:ArsR family transcriptional regulator [Frankiales bacterium]
MDRDEQQASGVDEIDLALLRILRRDSRLSARALARAVGMSPGAIGERLERLRARGVLTRYTVDVDLGRLGLSLEVLVGVRLNARGSVERTIVQLADLPGVIRVSVITGQWDLLVHMRVSGHEKLAETLLDEVWNIPDIRDSETMMVLDSRSRDPLESSGDDSQDTGSPGPD